MRTYRHAFFCLVLLAALASTASAQVPPAPPGLKVGTLGCTMSPTIGLVFGAIQTISCQFTPDGPYPPEAYVGTFGTLGIDIGIVAAGGLAWGVYNATDDKDQARLELPGGTSVPVAWLAIGLGFVLWLTGTILVYAARSRRKPVLNDQRELLS